MLSCQKSLFSLDESVTYLNCAYMAPLTHSIEAAGIQGIRHKSEPYKSQVGDFFDPPQRVREAFAQLIHAPDPQRICLIPAVSYGISIVTQNVTLKRGEEIVLVGEQFPSNVYPWMRLAEEHGGKVRLIDAPKENQDRGKKWNERILEAITPQTRIVALGHVHWADGTLFDLQAIRDRSREVDALMIVDGTQSVGALPFDVQTLDPDALICAGYKWLMGPYSIGVAYLGEYFDNGKPLEENWKNRHDSHIFSQLVNYQPQYQPGALRYEVGEASNFILIPMLLEALNTVNQWQPEAIQDYCEELVAQSLEALQTFGCWVEDATSRGSHLFGVRLPANLNPIHLKQAFEKEQIYVSVRGDAVRISPHVYNEPHHMEKLVNCIQKQVYAL